MSYQQLNVMLPKAIKKSLDIYCAKNDRKQKEVVALAIEKFLSVKPEKAN